MAFRHFGLAVLLAGCGCEVLAGMGTSLGTSNGSPTATTGASARPALAPAMVVDDPTVLGQEQLRDPRERHLRHLRQLTHSRVVSMPRFSPDGRWIYVAEKRAKEIVLLRVSASDPSKGIEELPPPDPGATFWGLVDGKGEPCAVTSKKDCASTGWPEIEALLGCETQSLTPLAAGSPSGTCPAQKGVLPCALGTQGSEVCPVRVADALRLVLWKPAAVAAVPLGPASGSSWMPALSRNGERLVFVTRPAEGPSHLMISFIDHVDPQPEPFGPEAARTLDPTFAPAGDRVVFASTADDASGQELDLLMVSVIGGALERITFTPGADRFPTFSPDGHSIAWISERNADAHAQDLFVAEWVAEP